MKQESPAEYTKRAMDEWFMGHTLVAFEGDGTGRFWLEFDNHNRLQIEPGAVLIPMIWEKKEETSPFQ